MLAVVLITLFHYFIQIWSRETSSGKIPVIAEYSSFGNHARIPCLAGEHVMAAEWFCRIDDVIYGPLAARELKRLAELGKLKESDSVRKSASGPWVRANSIKGLVAGPLRHDTPALDAPSGSVTSAPRDPNALPVSARNVVRDYDIVCGRIAGTPSDLELRRNERRLKLELESWALGAIAGPVAGAMYGVDKQVPDPNAGETKDERENRYRREALGRLECRGYPVKSHKSLRAIIEALRAETIDVLEAFLSTTNPSGVRIGAIAAIRDLQSGKTISLLTPLLVDRNETIRYKALEAMTSLGVGSAYAILPICKVLLHSFPALLEMSYCQGPLRRVEPLSLRVLPSLLEAMDSKDPSQRMAAISQVQGLDEDGWLFLEKLRGIAADDQEPPEVRELATLAVKSIEPSSAYQEELARRRTVLKTAAAANWQEWEVLLITGGVVFVFLSIIGSFLFVAEALHPIVEHSLSWWLGSLAFIIISGALGLMTIGGVLSHHEVSKHDKNEGKPNSVSQPSRTPASEKQHPL